jgi:hypothetical protein
MLPLILLAFMSGALAQGSNLDAAIQAAGISFIPPSSSDFPSASEAFNQRLAYKPAAIAYPTDANQIAQLVQIGAQNNVSVTARSGGHSYAALGLGGKDGSLISALANQCAEVADNSAQSMSRA